MSTPFEYVVNSLKLVRKAKETERSYIERIIVAISTLSESKWEELPEELQVWYNEAAEVVTSEDGNDKDFPPLPGFNDAKPDRKALVEKVDKAVEEVEDAVEDLEDAVEELEEELEEDGDLEEDEEEEEKPTKSKEKPKAKKEPKAPKAPKIPKERKEPKEPKEPKVKKEKAPPKPKREGPIAAEVVREILCGDMSLSIDQTMEALVARGVAMQRSSLQVVHLNTVRAFQKAFELGVVKDGGKVLLVKA